MCNRTCVLAQLVIWALGLWRFISPEVYAQPSAVETPPEDIIEKQVILLDLLRSINQLEQQLKETQKSSAIHRTKGEKTSSSSGFSISAAN